MDEPRAIPLTPRQAEIIRLVMLGQTNREISSAIGIRRKSIETALTKIYRIYGVANRVELREHIQREDSA